eukprot:3134319-Prymnesium_polylepis.1
MQNPTDLKEIQAEKRRVRQRLQLLDEQERLLAQTPKPSSATDLRWQFKLPADVDPPAGLAISEEVYTPGAPLRIPNIQNMGKDLALEELRICP